MLLLLVSAGCQRARRIVVEVTPETSVTTRTDTTLAGPPKLQPLPRAGLRMSFPEVVRLYRSRLDAPALPVVEVEITDHTVTVRTDRGESVHRIPPKGETKYLRPDSIAFSEHVRGEPEPVRTSVELPDEESFFEQFRQAILLTIVALIIVAFILKQSG